MLHHPKHLSSLTPAEQNHLASLLTLFPDQLTTTGQPSQAWLATQAHLISTTIPTTLRAPRTALARFLHSATSSNNPRAALCPAHSGLNSRLVRAVFSLLTAEVEHKRATRPLRRYLRHLGRYHTEKSGDGELLRALMNRLAGVTALWLDPEEFARVNPGLWTRHVLVEGGCEACVLALVGGDEGVLRDLGAVVAGRTHRRKAAPALGGLIAAWMVGMEGEGKMVKGERERLGRVVKRVRKAVWKHRRDKRRPRSATSSKRGSRREMARDSGYGSATGSSGDLAAWKRFEGGVARVDEHASLLSSCGHGWDGCDDDDDDEPFIPSVVDYDVYLRKRQQAPLHQSGVSDISASTHGTLRQSILENNEYDIYLQERQSAPPQHQPHDAFGDCSSSSTLHVSQHSAEEDEYDDNDDHHEFNGRQLGAWHSMHTDTADAESRPALRARNSLALRPDGQGDGRDSIGTMKYAKPLALSLVDDGSQGRETFDPAQWTDVSVATRDSRGGWGEVVGCCGSSSVYSTAGTAVPHPPVPAMSTVVGGNELRRALPSSEELAWTTWPNPFVDVAPSMNTTSGSGSDSQTSSCMSSWLHFTAAGTLGESSMAAFLSPDEFQRALDRLEELSLVDEPGDENGGMMDNLDGTILPGESASAVGRCVCMTRVELQAKGAAHDCDM
ncbi:hypothetical protein N0V82_004016 [Gnomoniopsis sp. IMI 355080]|nr:hypothetical protein N0V82_004016 [Gnomoniopsis sp. IMI 355080]